MPSKKQVSAEPTNIQNPAPKFPEISQMMSALLRSCNHVISKTFVEYPEDYRGRGPIFHAHVYADKREYLISMVPTDLDGPDA